MCIIASSICARLAVLERGGTLRAGPSPLACMHASPLDLAAAHATRRSREQCTNMHACGRPAADASRDGALAQLLHRGATRSTDGDASHRAYALKLERSFLI